MFLAKKYIAEDYYNLNTENNIMHLSVVACGDIMTHGVQIKSAFNKENGTYDFSRYFKYTKKHIQKADLAICNVETTMGGGNDFKGFPRFNTPDSLADAISDAGFTVASTANNHSFDTELNGIIRTREQLEKKGIKVVGTRKNTKEKKYALIDVKGVSVAVLNYTYETSKRKGRKTLNNHLLDNKSAELVNSFSYQTLEDDLSKIESDIKSARKAGAKIVIVYYHWGYEYDRVSLTSQKYIAYRTAKMGCDAILGSHPHVLQESDYITITSDGKEKNIPVFYSLGNYVWGCAPMGGRETVLNGALAKFDIEFNTDTQKVADIRKSYVPLVINISNEGEKNYFDVLDLDNMNEESEYLFKNGNHGKSVEEIREEISQTINNELEPNPKKFHFDRMLEIYVGEKIKSVGNIIPETKEYIVFKSDDAVIASALSNGEIVGNFNGYTGINAISNDGCMHMFMAHVFGEGISQLPVLVDQNNRVRDLYNPPNRVTGEEWDLPEEDMSLKMNAAQAWIEMHDAAINEGVYLKCVHAFRCKKNQLIKINGYSKRYGKDAAKRRYMPVGSSEHHLGYALDIANDTKAGNTTKEQAILWVMKNAHHFGFVARKLKAKMEYTPYIHIRYYPNNNDARIMHDNELTLDEYLKQYEKLHQ